MELAVYIAGDIMSTSPAVVRVDDVASGQGKREEGHQRDEADQPERVG